MRAANEAGDAAIGVVPEADGGRRAVFLDRDNTIIADPGYLNDAQQVALLPGAAGAIRRLNEAGYFVVVVSNQSGVARGRITERQLAEVHQRLGEVLGAEGARLDAIYYCPFLAGVEATVPRYRKDSNERKPGPGMLLRAAQEHGLNLARSWMVGDRPRDVLAGQRAGCRTVRLSRQSPPGGESQSDFTCESLAEAVDHILEAGDGRLETLADAKSADREERGGLGASPSREGGESEELSAILVEIRDVLRRQERRSRQEDFSIARLMGTLTQMLAVVAAGWGVAAMFGDGQGFVGKLLLAIFLQILALTAVVAGRR